MLHTKFKAPGPSGSEGEDFFKYFLCISMAQTQDPLAWGHFILGAHYLNKLGKGTIIGHAT